jgi:hypothetical protein
MATTGIDAYDHTQYTKMTWDNKMHLPSFCFGLVWQGWASGRGWRYMSVIIPVTVVNISSNLAQVKDGSEK